ncbi:MAG: class B sortase [Oscillospiraceae bacterium]|nr:class B sortase [Oscillospiraceae bacterium]
MKKKLPLLILGIAFLAIACFSGYNLAQILAEYHKGTQTYDELAQYVNTAPSVTPSAQEQEDDGTVWPEVDFEALKAVNDDIVGWIYLEGTEINYPVVRGDDNSYYLDKLYDGTVNGSGSIFMDFRNEPNFVDKNNILYGHSMNNGSMFTAIKRFKHQSYYDEHPVALLMTPDKNYKIEFFTGYVANVEQDAWDYYFDTEEDFQHWLDSSKSKSTFASNVVPTVDDEILTLSTCTYEFDNARYVLVGVMR